MAAVPRFPGRRRARPFAREAGHGLSTGGEENPMMKRVVQSLVVAAMVVVAGVPARAQGPAEGIWQLTFSSAGGTFSLFASVHQNGSAFVSIQLDTADGTWQYALGTISGSSVSGSSFHADGSAHGTFTITLTSATTLTGQSTDKNGTSSFTGVRVF